MVYGYFIALFWRAAAAAKTKPVDLEPGRKSCYKDELRWMQRALAHVSFSPREIRRRDAVDAPPTDRSPWAFGS
jgi:hypothetical protein